MKQQTHFTVIRQGDIQTQHQVWGAVAAAALRWCQGVIILPITQLPMEACSSISAWVLVIHTPPSSNPWSPLQYTYLIHSTLRPHLT